MSNQTLEEDLFLETMADVETEEAALEMLPQVTTFNRWKCLEIQCSVFGIKMPDPFWEKGVELASSIEDCAHMHKKYYDSLGPHEPEAEERSWQKKMRIKYGLLRALKKQNRKRSIYPRARAAL